MTTKTTETNDLFGDVIYQYTRKQAIEDGYQIPLVDIAASGKISLHDQMLSMYKYQVYFTREVYDLIEKAVENKRHMNDWAGVLWDIMWMSQRASRPIDPTASAFVVKITGAGRKQNYLFIAECGPTDDDDPTPAITIKLA